MSGSAAAAQAWGDTLAACALGVERAGVPSLPSELDGLAASNGPEGLLLAAAALGPWRMAGRVPDPGGAVLVEPMQETLPECSDAAASRLEMVLSGRGPQKQVCREWCRLAAAAGVRVPAGLAARLYAHTKGLDWAGEAGTVLAGRLPWLRGLDGVVIPEPSASNWSGPDLPGRVAALRLMRADPGGARAALAAVWASEPADARTRLLAALGTGLCAEDEPFLEERLDDRSVQVRAEALRLLSDLPGSRWCLRMQTRARAAVQFRPGGLLSRDAMTVVLPEPDDTARRDGLDAKGAAGPGGVLLGQLAAAAPLASWAGPGDASAPERWIKLALAGDWAETLVQGWSAAAARERDPAWLAALLSALTAVPKPKPWVAQALQTIAPAMPTKDLEQAVLTALHDSPQQLGSLLPACIHAWSPAFTRAALDWLAAKPAVSDASAVVSQHYAMKSVLDLLAVHGDPELAGLLSALQAALPEKAVPMLRRAFDDAAATLTFRRAMHQEFAR